MPRVVNFIAEMLSLEAELKDLEQAQDDLPYGAHIHALFQLAIVRIEEQIATLKRVCALTNSQFPLPGAVPA
jgi:hypothetical protein